MPVAADDRTGTKLEFVGRGWSGAFRSASANNKCIALVGLSIERKTTVWSRSGIRQNSLWMGFLAKSTTTDIDRPMLTKFSTSRQDGIDFSTSLVQATGKSMEGNSAS